MWSIAVWVWPVWDSDERDANGKRLGNIVKPGRWMPKGTVETDEEAEELVLRVARRSMLARAKWTGAARDESALTGMQAGPTGFQKWSGSGGRP